MSLSREEIIDAIADMSVLDLSELIKEVEDKFGVSAQSHRGGGGRAGRGGRRGGGRRRADGVRRHLVRLR